MSASIRLDADQLRRIAAFLAAVSSSAKENNVRIAVHTRGELSVDDESTLAFSWDREREEYVIDDRVGD